MKTYSHYILLNWIFLLAKEDNERIDFAVGGQAVIEGVMMRSPNSISIAVRKPAGSIKVKKENYRTLTQKFKALNFPVIRGVINLFEMMFIGTKAINFSANESIEDDVKPLKKGKKSRYQKPLEILMFAISLIIALLFSIFLFKFLPLYITSYLDKQIEAVHDNWIFFNLIDGFIKVSIFLSYIFILSRIKSFKRVFEYHGAEHKSIFTYEKKLPLTVNNAKKQTRFHPRCGTSFIFIVFIISILVYTVIPKQEFFWQNLLLRIGFLPLIAGISYEFLKLSAKYQNSKVVKFLVSPGLAFQKLTTAQPDGKQLEVGLKSLKEALSMEKNA